MTHLSEALAQALEEQARGRAWLARQHLLSRWAIHLFWLMTGVALGAMAKDVQAFLHH